MRWLLAAGLLRSGRAEIQILSPPSLIRDFEATSGRIIGSTATFGTPYYGEKLVGMLRWAPSKEPEKGPHCRADDYDLGDVEREDYELETNEEGRKVLNIVIVRRGICTFVHKVKIAQEHKHAHAVIIVDREDSEYNSQTIQNIIPADDGYGSQVHIPAILISKQDGDKLIETVKRDDVLVQLEWDVPTMQIAQIDMWMSSAATELEGFVRDFGPFREKLSWNLAFYPHYNVFSLPTKDYQTLCWEEDGAFCAADPDGPLEVTGRDVLYEDVRQLCILESTLQVDPNHESNALYSVQFWKYLAQFQEQCKLAAKEGETLTANRRFGKTCGDQVMANILTAANVDRVEECIQSTAVDKLREHRSNVAWSPRAIRINGWRYAGPVDADTIGRAVCAAYKEKPPECLRKFRIGHFITEYTEEGIPLPVFVLAVIFGVACVALFATTCYKKIMSAYISASIREEVMLEVKHQMADYAPLRDSGR